jgi:hypothetical protein
MPKALERILDALRHVVPGLALTFGRAKIVENFLKVNAAQVRAPGGQRLGKENIQCLMAKLAHPVRLVLLIRDLIDDGVVEATRVLKKASLHHESRTGIRS